MLIITCVKYLEIRILLNLLKDCKLKDGASRFCMYFSTASNKTF